MGKTEETALSVKSEDSLEINPTATAIEKQTEIQSMIIVAKKFPRNEDVAFEKLMKASKRTSFAKKAAYSFPRAGTQIEGPSINISREAARVWTNIRYGIEVISEDEESRTIRAYAHDIETNTYVSSEDTFAKLIYRKASGWIAPDERDLRELTNRRGAILLRGCLLQILPKDLIEDALMICKKTLLKEASQDPEGTRKNVIISFSELNITPEMLETFLGHKIAECSPAELEILRKIYTSISDGQSTWAEYTQPKDAAPDTATINITPGNEPNRGHGKENLDQIGKDTGKPENAQQQQTQQTDKGGKTAAAGKDGAQKDMFGAGRKSGR